MSAHGPRRDAFGSRPTVHGVSVGREVTAMRKNTPQHDAHVTRYRWFLCSALYSAPFTGAPTRDLWTAYMGLGYCGARKRTYGSQGAACTRKAVDGASYCAQHLKTN